MRTVMAGEPHPPPPGRDLEKGVGCGLWAGGWGAAVRDARRGRGRRGAQRSRRTIEGRGRERYVMGDGPCARALIREFIGAPAFARHRAGGPALACLGI